jgi:ribosome-associated translation inhibitor RaiA
MADFVNFDYEFYSEIDQPDEALRREAEERMRALAEGHRDMIGASVAVEELTGSETPYRYEARVVAYIKPDNLVAVEKAEHALPALKAALDAMERRVRKLRAEIRDKSRRP